MIGQVLAALVLAAPVGSLEPADGESADHGAPTGEGGPGEGLVVPVAPVATELAPPPERAAAGAPGPRPEPRGPSFAPEQTTSIFSRTLAVGLGARWGQRVVDGDRASAAILLGSVLGRFAGYASSRPRFGGGRRFITPELLAAIAVGSTLSAPTRVIGTEGVLRIGIGRSLATRVSPYGKLQLDPRFAAYLHDIAEANFITAALRGSGGLLARNREESFVLLAGATVEGIGGAQRLGSRSAIAQVMAGAELGIYAQAREELALMLVGDVRTTILGEQRGGQRTDGRSSFEMLFGSSSGSMVSVLATYAITEIRADVPLGRGATGREYRLGHALTLGFGLRL